MSAGRAIPLLLLAGALVACRRAPVRPPIDEVTQPPASGPLVFLPEVEVLDPSGQTARPSGDNVPGGFIAPLFVDPDTGAAHRWMSIDASCASLVSTSDDVDGGRSLNSVDSIVGYSPVRQLFFISPSSPETTLFSLSLDGRCAPVWRGPHDTWKPSVSADGTTVSASSAVEPPELSRVDGTAPRTLTWLKPPAFSSDDEVRLSPTADRVAVVRNSERSAAPGLRSFSIATCDLSGACTSVLTAERFFRDVQWSPDGSRLACLSVWPNDSTSIAIVEVAHPERPVVEIHPGARDEKRGGFAEAMLGGRGGINAFGWSPDSRRLALASSHEGGVTPGHRDMPGTTYQGLYVVGADGSGLHLVRGGLGYVMDVFWVR